MDFYGGTEEQDQHDAVPDGCGEDIPANHRHAMVSGDDWTGT